MKASDTESVWQRRLTESGWQRVSDRESVWHRVSDKECKTEIFQQRKCLTEKVSDRECKTEMVRQRVSDRECQTESARQRVSDRECLTESARQRVPDKDVWQRKCLTESARQRLSDRECQTERGRESLRRFVENARKKSREVLFSQYSGFPNSKKKQCVLNFAQWFFIYFIYIWGEACGESYAQATKTEKMYDVRQSSWRSCENVRNAIKTQKNPENEDDENGANVL